jgi:predicted transcriptional regulator
MAGKSPSLLSGREYAILKVLWQHGPLTVRAVRERLRGGDDMPYTTVLSLLQLLERKGYVRHEAQGKTYQYAARVAKHTTTRKLLRDLVRRFFDGSVEALLMGLASSRELTPELLEKLRAEVETRPRRDRADE